MATLLAGLPQVFPAQPLTACGSGLDALGFAARAIKAGDGDLLIAGGVSQCLRHRLWYGQGSQCIFSSG
ncbi:beta-ketoacyl synthase N-terminal-like domain-containing protein [Escherichia coli]|uniref:beta-ketoacyl synthase N-terminal-like domain-containing protein n=1 Tax=Escherichia coli TaxID=562 RepID=UPI0035B680D7